MATVTPNFNWPVPTSTDLVKDGATAIEALGDSIDGSLVDLKGGTTGQVLSKTSGTDMDFTWVTTDDANAIQNSIVDAKGDLIAATANDTPARLAVGTNGQTIVADSTASTGLKYSNNAPLGGMTSLGTVALTGATTITLSGLSNISRVTLLINGASSVNASSYITLRFNGDSTNNYGFAGNYSSNGTLANAYAQNDTSIPVAKQGNTAANVISALVNVNGGFSDGMLQYNLGSYANGSGFESYNWTGFYNNTKITSISLISSTGNFDAGFMYVFGA
jgi:hypothetical protein